MSSLADRRGLLLRNEPLSFLRPQEWWLARIATPLVARNQEKGNSVENQRPVRGWLAVTGALLLLSAPGFATAPQKCVRHPLEVPARKALSAVWNAAETEVAVADLASGVVLVYSLEGKLQRRVVNPGQGTLEFSRPSALRAVPGGYLLADAPLHLVWLDPLWKGLRALDLRTAGAGATRVGFVTSIHLVEQDLFSFATVSKAEEPVGVGLVRVPLEDPGSAEVLLPVTEEGAAIDLYRLGGDFVAELGKRIFFLHYDPTIRIVEAWPRRRALAAFPAGLETLPSLPPLGGREEVAAFRALVSRKSMPVGIYSDGESIYLLARNLTSEGQREWRLSRIDEAADRLARTVVLPTSAPNLVLVPGKSRWLLLEKETATNEGERVTSMIEIPAQWITSSQTPLGVPGVTCTE